MSRALDTNGQNARYVRAAERWGSDPAVLRALAIGNADPAGVVGRYRSAAAKAQDGLVIREAHKASAYFNFPTDIVWTRKTEGLVRALASEADVIHLNNSDVAYRALGLRKPALLHHHGSLFRSDPAHWFAVARRSRMVQAVSTIDLTRPDEDELAWLPTAYDIDDLEAIGAANRRTPDGMLRVVSAPTNRSYKATAALIAAVDGLRSDGLPVELVLVEGKTWRQCLVEKAKADVVFDQVAFGYGCNSIEAWGMGVPVIAGADPWTLDAMRRRFGDLPFYEATETTIADAIRAMLSYDLRSEWAERGMAHVRQWHDERPALAMLAELYARAIETYSSAEARRAAHADPVTFASATGRPVYVDGVRIDFPGGRVTVDTPEAIKRLRTLAQRRNFGISEVTA